MRQRAIFLICGLAMFTYCDQNSSNLVRLYFKFKLLENLRYVNYFRLAFLFHIFFGGYRVFVPMFALPRSLIPLIPLQEYHESKTKNPRLNEF